MLSFEVFSEMVTRWKSGEEEARRVEDMLMTCFERRPIMTLGQDTRNALAELICMMCGLPKDSDLIWWWAFEDVEKTITVNKEKVYDVSTLEGLYKYITDGNESVAQNSSL